MEVKDVLESCKNPSTALIDLVNQLVGSYFSHSEQIRDMQSRIQFLERALDNAKTKDQNYSQSTVLEYARKNNFPIYISELAKFGKLAAGLCKRHGYPTSKVYIKRMGTATLFPDFILHEMFTNYFDRYPQFKDRVIDNGKESN